MGKHVNERKGAAGAGSAYVSLIDGVRGVAALAILFYHYVHFFMAGPSRDAPDGASALFPAYERLWLLYDYGYLAVQVFWLVSGFVFAFVYYGPAGGTRSFAVNRFARLYPLHFLTLLVVAGLQFVALSRFGYTPLYGHYDWLSFALQLFMASDWVRRGGGYSFNGPVWSVSVEIVIYAVFWLSRGAVARFGLPVLAAGSAGFYALHAQWGEYSKVFACGFYFFAGCAFCLLYRRSRERRGLLVPLVSVFGAIGLAGAIGGNDWSWRYIALPGLCGALFIALAASEPRAPAWLRRACQWLGENTYGVYLWHVPVQLALFLLLMPGTDPAGIARNGWFMAGYLALVVLVARASFVWFERPARDALRRAFGSAAPAGRVGAP